MCTTPATRRVQTGQDGIAFRADAYQTLELVQGSQPTVAEYTTRLRRAKVEAALAREQKEREAIGKQKAVQYAKAKVAKAPADYVVLVQAEKFTKESGGKVTITSRKVATYGDAFLNWDNRGHSIEYDLEVAHEGYYRVMLKYCREGGPVIRSLQIDGAYPGEAARQMEMPGTGGWSNGADNWKLYTLGWPLIGEPYLVLLTKGEHRLRLENVSGGGLNLDYVLFVPAFVEVSRGMVEK